MKASIYYIIIGIFILTSCSKPSTNIEYENISPTIVYDSIETRMPGQLFLYEKYFVWTDPFEIEGQAHIIDIKSNKEIEKIINIGEGPDDFITPIFIKSSSNRLIVGDMNNNKIGYCYFNDTDKQSKIEIQIKRENTKDKNRIIEIEKDDFLFFDAGLKQPFNYKGVNFGKNPIDNNVGNKKEIYQGNIAYCNLNEYLIYSTILFPYIAAYKRNGDYFELVWEKTGDIDYDIIDNNIRLNYRKKGISELTLTKDYIVALQRDYATDPTDETTVGRDFDKLPKTLFIYDYDGNLKKILNFKLPIIRISSYSNENTIYIIGLNPDFTLMKYNIPI